MAMVLAALALLVGIAAGPSAATETTATSGQPPAFGFTSEQSLGEAFPLESLPAGAKQVTVGIYPINVYDMDLEANTYYMNAYIWLRWRGDFDPVATLEFANAVENWGFTQVMHSETPKVLADGSKYIDMRIEGRFFQQFDLSRFPLDKQELALWIESASEPISRMVYLPDAQASGYGDSVRLAAWQIAGYSGSAWMHDYGTDFSDTSLSQGQYSALKFAFSLERNINMFVWKLLIPLLIVMATSWLALLVTPRLVEVRLAMPAGALLSVIFLRDMVMSEIPETPTLVLADLIYVLAYAFILVTLVEIVWVNLTIDKDSPASVARLTRADHWSFLVQIILFSSALALLLHP
jgi:hypothetical protein